MKLCKAKTWLPLSAAMITIVTNPVGAAASTVYTVQKNDTLEAISKQYEVSVQSLKQANSKVNDQINIGERLTIPGSSTANEYVQKNNSAVSSNTYQAIYQVKSGDTLSSISQQYKVSIQSIKQTNNVDGSQIFVGQHLKIDTGISLQEVDLMARLVNAEAGGEPHKGKVAVAKVVLNRANANGFPNTITDVIYEPIKNGYAFTPVTDGRINQPATQEARMAVEEALTSKGTNSDWLYFYNPKTSTDKWITTRQTVAQIGNHLFAK
ncbi:cell wall hydrolase [Bacillus wiedmannii]|uniref:Peptigoglycan-binding protein LysM n=1 Tax=Bacillus wiedmannii TaxID=1890302 RepID=A0ABD6THC8_9BACI|nr:LysM peptidoglycan-binding domain-containing protein [Bacillus wiedmannii]PEO55387.1 peptigoglycan-binding protein LysM [Bacillus wiedmannii]PFX59803.1 peptigoglycan-binding protein LysM [Bacillus wiedmannii]PGC73003.1 peptigoglycan-binding protein LysM [Bacillus wiedmannii]PHG14539.1 peptigoglycan-binding protein LysM [Bacillus wiedmannii]